MHIETSHENCHDSALSFDRVIGVLDHALRLFGEGDEEQACICLAEANRVLDSCLAGEAGGAPIEAGVTPISVANSIPSRSVEMEEVGEKAVLATIA